MIGRALLAAALAALAAGCASSPKSSPAAENMPDAIGALIESRNGSEPSPAPTIEPAPAPVATDMPAVTPPAAAPGSLDAYLAGLRLASCPKGVRAGQPEGLALSVTPVPLSGLNRGLKRVGELTYVGGFQLTSPDARFGGLSGLDLLEDGRLLAASDQGDFVWIELAGDGVTPVGARIAGMKDASGASLRGKADGDAEGLAVQDGLALVSFERNHRVLAYDLGHCGAAALGAPIVTDGRGRPLPEAFAAAGIEVSDNAGAEPLALSPDWVLFTGLETRDGGAGPLSARPLEGAPEFDLRVAAGAPDFVGLDLLPSDTPDGLRGYSLHRLFSPARGLSIKIVETLFEPVGPATRTGSDADRADLRYRIARSRPLADLGMLLNIDNFEGIAAHDRGDGVTRLYLVSDDNFSSSQRTLLMIFDLAA